MLKIIQIGLLYVVLSQHVWASSLEEHRENNGKIGKSFLEVQEKVHKNHPQENTIVISTLDLSSTNSNADSSEDKANKEDKGKIAKPWLESHEEAYRNYLKKTSMIISTPRSSTTNSESSTSEDEANEEFIEEEIVCINDKKNLEAAFPMKEEINYPLSCLKKDVFPCNRIIIKNYNWGGYIALRNDVPLNHVFCRICGEELETYGKFSYRMIKPFVKQDSKWTAAQGLPYNEYLIEAGKVVNEPEKIADASGKVTYKVQEISLVFYINPTDTAPLSIEFKESQGDWLILGFDGLKDAQQNGLFVKLTNSNIKIDYFSKEDLRFLKMGPGEESPNNFIK